MAVKELRFSLHLVKRSSHPLYIFMRTGKIQVLVSNILDETTLILVVNQIKRVISPYLFDLFDILLESHL